MKRKIGSEPAVHMKARQRAVSTVHVCRATAGRRHVCRRQLACFLFAVGGGLEEEEKRQRRRRPRDNGDREEEGHIGRESRMQQECQAQTGKERELVKMNREQAPAKTQRRTAVGSLAFFCSPCGPPPSSRDAPMVWWHDGSVGWGMGMRKGREAGSERERDVHSPGIADGEWQQVAGGGRD